MVRSASQRRSALSVRGRSGLLWGLALFVGGQVALLLAMESWWPALRDPEYGRKLARLRARLEEEPAGRPLVLALGSSRVSMGFRPEVVATGTIARRAGPVVFNFGISGAGPVMELLYLRRLVADGIHPALLVVEVWPPLMSEHYQQEHFENDIPLFPLRFQNRDWAVLDRYCTHSQAMRRDWYHGLLVPCFAQRFCWLTQWGSSWLAAAVRQDQGYRHLDDWGRLWIRDYLVHDEAVYRARSAQHCSKFRFFLDSYRVSPVVDQALRELLGLCRQQGIPVALLFLPEASVMRGWYGEPTSAAVNAYLQRLSQESCVPLIDARAWVGDDGFSDSHHLTPEGALRFSERLEREIVQPVLAGRLSLADRSLNPEEKVRP